MANDVLYEQKFNCINEKCNNFKKVEQIYVWQSNLEKDIFPICSSCGEPLEIFIPEDKSSELMINFNAFSSLTLAQKKQSLLKRSKNHFNKAIKEKKIFMDNNH